MQDGLTAMCCARLASCRSTRSKHCVTILGLSKSVSTCPGDAHAKTLLQLEGQQLMGRMREVSMHLPPHSSQVCGDEDDSGSDSEDDEDDDDDHHKCPFPGCRRNKSFKTKESLVIHFQKRMSSTFTRADNLFMGNYRRTMLRDLRVLWEHIQPSAKVS